MIIPMIKLAKKSTVSALCALACISLTTASGEVVSGQILNAEGHEALPCRRILLKTSDAQVHWFRISETNKEDGMMAVVLTALTTGLIVDVTYTTGVRTRCGTEPKFATSL